MTIPFPFLIINRSSRRKNYSNLSTWVKKYKRGLVLFTNIKELGDSVFVQQFFNDLNLDIEVVVINSIIHNGKKSFLIGGNTEGYFTQQLRKWVAQNRKEPFLFVKKSEAELLILLLQDRLNEANAWDTIRPSLLKSIDLKTIEKGFIFYSGRNHLKQIKQNIHWNWINKKLKLISKYCIKTLTIWGTPDLDLLKKICNYPFEKIMIYPNVSSPLLFDKRIEGFNNLCLSANGTDAILIVETRPEFTSIQFWQLRGKINKQIMIDPFYLFEAEEMRALKWKYYYR